jgi:hypothetical protein
MSVWKAGQDESTPDRASCVDAGSLDRFGDYRSAAGSGWRRVRVERSRGGVVGGLRGNSARSAVRVPFSVPGPFGSGCAAVLTRWASVRDGLGRFAIRAGRRWLGASGVPRVCGSRGVLGVPSCLRLRSGSLRLSWSSVAGNWRVLCWGAGDGRSPRGVALGRCAGSDRRAVSLVILPGRVRLGVPSGKGGGGESK